MKAIEIAPVEKCPMHEFVMEHRKYCPFVIAGLIALGICIHKCCQRRKEDKLKKHIAKVIKKYEEKYGEISKKERKYIVEELNKALKEQEKQDKKEKHDKK